MVRIVAIDDSKTVSKEAFDFDLPVRVIHDYDLRANLFFDGIYQNAQVVLLHAPLVDRDKHVFSELRRLTKKPGAVPITVVFGGSFGQRVKARSAGAHFDCPGSVDLPKLLQQRVLPHIK